MTLTKEDYESWKDNPVTRQYFVDIATNIKETQSDGRMGTSIDEVALKNAHAQGFIDGLSELEEWYDIKLEEFNEDQA